MDIHIYSLLSFFSKTICQVTSTARDFWTLNKISIRHLVHSPTRKWSITGVYELASRKSNYVVLCPIFSATWKVISISEHALFNMIFGNNDIIRVLCMTQNEHLEQLTYLNLLVNTKTTLWTSLWRESCELPYRIWMFYLLMLADALAELWITLIPFASSVSDCDTREIHHSALSSWAYGKPICQFHVTSSWKGGMHFSSAFMSVHGVHIVVETLLRWSAGTCLGECSGHTCPLPGCIRGF